MSQRAIDMRAEQELARFLDEHFYRELLKEGKFVSFQRVDDFAMQKQGVDVIGETADSVAYIDEKAQLHYMNLNIPTFAFELEFMFNGEAIEGWFLNDKLKTTHYLLLSPNAKTTDLSKITSYDFTQVEGLMVSKKKLKQYLDEIGLDAAVLKRSTRILRQTGATGRQKTPYDGIKFYVSSAATYSENPVNLVINKNILRKLADAHYMITQVGFRRRTM